MTRLSRRCLALFLAATFALTAVFAAPAAAQDVIFDACDSTGLVGFTISGIVESGDAGTSFRVYIAEVPGDPGTLLGNTPSVGAEDDPYSFHVEVGNFAQVEVTIVRVVGTDELLIQSSVEGCEQPEPGDLPTAKDQCKHHGWRIFLVFKNQGDCVAFVKTGGQNPPSGPPKPPKLSQPSNATGSRGSRGSSTNTRTHH